MNSDTATTALACQGCGNTAHEIARSDKLDVSLCGECWDRRTDAAEAVISNGRTVGTSYGLPVGEGEGVGAGLGTLPPTRLPTPTGNSGTEDEIDLLLGDYATGVLVPVEVELGSMPARAGSTMNAIAEHMRLLMGLRLAVGEERALPYAVSVPVRAGLVKDASSASKAIRSLVRFGVVKHVGALPPLRPGCLGRSSTHRPTGWCAVARKLDAPIPRVALTPPEAAASLGVGEDFFTEHVRPELRLIRRGRKVLIPVAELEAWFERNAELILKGAE